MCGMQTHEYMHDPAKFESTAREHTLRHAMADHAGSSTAGKGTSGEVVGDASTADEVNARNEKRQRVL